MTEELRRHEPSAVSAAWLADRFTVSVRTIERDLTALRQAGVPVGADRSGGYRIDAGESWTPVALNPAKMAALLLAQTTAIGMPFADDTVLGWVRSPTAIPESAT